MFGQGLSDSLLLEKIKNASKLNSSVSEVISNFADNNGPRLLGTMNYYRSADWARQKLSEFGADTAYFESFDKQYRGWNVKSFNVEMTKPGYMHIISYPLAYVKSTNGIVEGDMVYLSHADSLNQLKGKLKGKIVLLGQDFYSFTASQQILPQRISKDLLQQTADNPDPNDLLIGYHRRRSTNQAIASVKSRVLLRVNPILFFCVVKAKKLIIAELRFIFLTKSTQKRVCIYRKNTLDLTLVRNQEELNLNHFFNSAKMKELWP